MRKEPRFEGVEQNAVFALLWWDWRMASPWKRIGLLVTLNVFPRQLLRDIWLAGVRAEEAVIGAWAVMIQAYTRDLRRACFLAIGGALIGMPALDALSVAPHGGALLMSFLLCALVCFIGGSAAIEPQGSLLMLWSTLLSQRTGLRLRANRFSALWDGIIPGIALALAGSAAFCVLALTAQLAITVGPTAFSTNPDPNSFILILTTFMICGGCGVLACGVAHIFRAELYRQSVRLTQEIIELSLLLANRPGPVAR